MRCLLLLTFVLVFVCFASSQDNAQETILLTKTLISENPVMIFSKSYCPYCRRAKDLLNKYGVNYKAYEIDQEALGADVQAALMKVTGQRTVPNIFINGKHIGGADALTALDAKGELVALLKEAGVKVHSEL